MWRHQKVEDKLTMYSSQRYKDSLIKKFESELADLTQEGLVSAGSMMSPVLFVCSEAAQPDAPLFSSDAGKALKASLLALGYAPEDWAALSVVSSDGAQISADLLNRALISFDPATMIVCDEAAAALVREVFANELAGQANLDAAMFAPGTLFTTRGIRTLNLGNFSAALSDTRQKQLMWARLKLVPPLSEPY